MLKRLDSKKKMALKKRVQPLRGWYGYSIRRQLLDKDLELVKPYIKGDVLEIGCGHQGRRGNFSPPIGQTKSWTYCDLKNRRLPDIQADVLNLPFHNHAFNTIVCLEVFEYVSDLIRGLKELLRTLKPECCLVISIPFLHRADADDDYWRWTKAGINHNLERAGFSVEIIYSQGAALACVTNILQFAIRIMRNVWWGWLLRALMFLPLRLLFSIDEKSSKIFPILSTFSTGYLVVARPSNII